MKYLLPLFLFTLVACDVPSQRRQLIKSGSNSVTPPSNISGADGFNSGNTTPVTSPSSGTGFENCSLAPKGSTISLGSIGICHNTLDQTQIKFQSSTTDSSMRTCFVPIQMNPDDSFIYLSSQPQCSYTISNKIYSGKLFINRSGYESSQMNGVMVMKENLLVPFYDCMNAFNFYKQNRNCTYEQDYLICRQQNSYFNSHSACCDKQAQNYSTLVCGTFVGNFSSHYLKIRLR